MKNIIYAYNKTSDAGFDTRSFSVFTKGCNLQCPYCMNSKLIDGKYKTNVNIMEKLKADVDAEKPKMIFISGGEPTLDSVILFAAINIFKSWGCKVGMSTNGTNPELLKKFASGYKKIDYVALDFKGDINAYKELGDSTYYMKVLSSWLILREEQKLRPEFDYEIRTTLYRPFVTKEVLIEMSNLFHPNEKWVLQQFRIVDNMPSKDAEKAKIYSEKELNSILESIIKTVPNTSIRYV